MQEVLIKDIPGFDGDYKITSDGRVISYHNYHGTNERVLKPQMSFKNGYFKICLSHNGKDFKRYIHRLVAEAFVANPLNLPEVNHEDCNKLNNSYTNLTWVNRSMNVVHARNNGLKQSLCKINMTIATEIRQIYKSGQFTQNQLGKRFNLSGVQIGNIVNNKHWKAA